MSSLDSELWKRVEPVLDRALELEGAEREAYLEQVFAEAPELRGEVESLLAEDERDGVLDRPFEHPGRELAEGLNSAEDPTALAEPRQIGAYRLIREVGAGGMGIVYEAEDLRLQRRVALKFLAREHGPDDGQLARFRREAKGLARLNHPNIVTLYSVEEHEGLPFITMELVEGVTPGVARAGPGTVSGALPLVRPRPEPGSGRRPPARHHPIATEAGQRDGGPGRPPEGPRLRTRQARRPAFERAEPRHDGVQDGRRRRHGNRSLHVTRAARRERSRRRHRSLLLRRHSLRDRHRTASLRRRELGLDHLRHPS